MRRAGVEAGQMIAILAKMSGLPETDDLERLTLAFKGSTLDASTVHLPADLQGLNL